MATPTSVTYMGIYGVRQITRPEWESVGVMNQDSVQWNSLNRWTVKGEKFTSEALEVLEAEGQFAFSWPESKSDKEDKKK